MRLINDKHAIIDVAILGHLHVFLDKPAVVGNNVKVTIRPEKIKISREKPSNVSSYINLLEGFVDEIIYSGFQSNFFVKLPNNFIFRVFKQHVKFFMDEKSIDWKDSVFIWWYANDGFIVEVEQK